MSTNPYKPASMPIRWIHPRRCLWKVPIQRGEVRRTPTAIESPTQCVGFDVACPSCGFRAIWIARAVSPENKDSVTFIEGPSERVTEEVQLRDTRAVIGYWRPSTLSVEGSGRCRLCGHTVTIVDGCITAA